MAESEQGVVWSARLDLTELEQDVIRGQALLDKLFERYANATVAAPRVAGGGVDPLTTAEVGHASPFTAAQVATWPGGAGTAASGVASINTASIDSAISKVERLIELMSRVSPGSVSSSAGLSDTLITEADVAESAAMPSRGGRWVPAGFRKRDIEQKFLAAYESQGGGYTVDDEQRLEEATQGAGDPFVFSGEKLPGEVRRYLQGAPREVRSLFRLARPGQRSGGPEAMAALGEEEYFSMAERIAGTPLRSAVAAAGGSDDPELQYLADFYANLPRRGGARHAPLESVAAASLQTGETFTVGGRRHTVTEPDEDDRRLTNESGLDVPLDALRNVAIDEGSRRRPKPVDLGDEPLAAPRTPRLTPSDTARVFAGSMGPEEELATTAAAAGAGGGPPLVPPSSRTFGFGEEPSGSDTFSRLSGGHGGFSARPATPQEAAGMSRAEFLALPSATVVGEEAGELDPLEQLASAAGEARLSGTATGGRSGISSLLAGGRFGRYFAGGVALFEAAELVGKLQERNLQISLHPDNELVRLQQNAGITEFLENIPIVGPFLLRPAEEKLIHGIGRRTGTETLFDYQKSLLDRETANSALSLSVQGATETGDVLDRASVLATQGEFPRERRAAQTAAEEARQRLLVQENELQRRVGIEQDPQQRQRLQQQLDAFQQNLPQQFGAIDELLKQQNLDIDRRVGLAQDALQRQVPGLAAAAEGSFGRAANLAFEAQQQTERAQLVDVQHLDPRIVDRIQSLQTAARGAEQDQALQQSEAASLAAGFELQRDPLGAARVRVAAQREQELAQAPFRDTNVADPAQARVNREFNDKLRQDIDARAAITLATVQHRFNDQQLDIGIGQDIRVQQIAALLPTEGHEPNPTLARALGTVGETETEALRLARAGFGSEARRATEIGAQEIALQRAEFLRSFGGTEVDPNRVDLSNPRNREDVPARLRELDEQRRNLLNFEPRIPALVADPAAGGFGLHAGATASAMEAAKNTVGGMDAGSFISRLAQELKSVITN